AALTEHPIEPARLDRDLQADVPRTLRGKRSVYPRDLPDTLVAELWRRFHAALAPLRDARKLDYVLFQMPKWFAPSREASRYLEPPQPRLPDPPVAVESRQAGWMRDERRARVVDLLRRLGLVYVSVDEPQGTPASVPPVAEATTESLAVVRFHGRKQ